MKTNARHEPGESRQKSELCDGLWLSLVFAVAGLFYAWIASPDKWILSARPEGRDGYYNLLVEGFRKGKLSLDVTPSPHLAELKDPYDPAQNTPYRIHDLSYYKGAIYMYFGVTPAVVLFWPYRAITGRFVAETQACVLFAWTGLAAGLWILAEIRRKCFPTAERWRLVTSAVAFAFCPMTPSLMSRTAFWEVPIAAAFAFFMLALAGVLRALGGERRCAWLAFASLSYGLAVGARPTYAFGALLLLVPVGAAWRSEGRSLRRVGFAAVAAVLPLGVVVMGLIAYNDARFGNPLDFGQRYQMAGINEHIARNFGFDDFLYNLRIYLLEPAQLSVYFPFVKFIAPPPTPSGYLGIEDPYGVLPNIPVALFALGTLGIAARPGILRSFAAAAALGTTATACFLFLFGGACSRYMADFLPGWMLLAAIGFLVGSAWIPRRLRTPWDVLWGLLLSVSVLFNALAAIGHNDLMRISHPGTYAPLARAFDWVPQLASRLVGIRYGPVLMTVEFPSARVGKLEPLVVSGASFKSDYVYLYYPARDEVVIGFEHTGFGGPVSQPIHVESGRTHSIWIDSGIFYPPAEDPYFASMPPRDAMGLKTRLQVIVDRVPYLTSTSEVFDPTRFEPMFGRSTPDRQAFSERFTGTLLELRTGVPAPNPLEPFKPGSALEIAVRFPPFSGVRSEPLVSSGKAQKGDCLFIAYLDSTHVSLGLDHWLFPARLSGPIETSYDSIHVFRISLGSFYGSQRPAGSPAERWEKLRNTLSVSMDATPLFEVKQPFYDSEPADVRILANEIGFSTCLPRFSGELLHQGPADPPMSARR